MIADKNFFKWLVDNGKDIIKLQPKNCIKAIKKSCEIKSNIVSMDEKESGVRAFLNLGHTFGHSIESITNYSKENKSWRSGFCWYANGSKILKLSKFM